MRLNEKSLFTLVLLAFVAVMFVMTLSLGRVARLVPLVVAVPTLVLLAVQLMLDAAPGLAASFSAMELKDPFGIRPRLESILAAVSNGGESDDARRHLREQSTFLWLTLMFALIYLFGFVVALPSYTFLYLHRRSGEGWMTSALVAAVMAALPYGIFVVALRLHLYEGVLWNWLGR